MPHRAGRFTRLARSPAWVFWLAWNNRIGADPVKELEHALGLWALRYLIAALAVTPIRRFSGLSLIRFRRALGLLAFFYAFAHLLSYLIFDQGLDARAIAADIVKRPSSPSACSPLRSSSRSRSRPTLL